ncbi:DUF4062 domain-containing protein [Rhizobium leguminosarum]|uniref:DUF4062 domain-containing protein n=1 Tax=Rhizobium leguminosarum TaxID=384 RepID=UPI003F9E3979
MGTIIASIFISSTFADMNAERDILTRRVFPRLRERFAPEGLSIYEIDLRWGVTQAMAQNQSAIDVCLDEIEHCTPLVLGMVGHRVGWVPTVVSNRSERTQMLTGGGQSKFDHAVRDNTWSMTEIELRFASALAEAQHLPGPLMLLRCLSLTRELTRSDTVLGDEVFEARDRIRALAPAGAVVDYDTLDQFELSVEKRLGALLQQRGVLQGVGGHRGAPRATHEVTQRTSLTRLTDHASQGKPLIVTGPPGVGASWILERYIGDNPGLLCDGRRLTIREIAANLAGEDNSSANRIDVSQAMMRLPPGRYVLDHFEQAFGAAARADLGRLAQKLPSGVQFVVMLRSPRLLQQAATLRLPLIEIPLLDVSERSDFIQAFLRSYGKSLDADQAQRLATAPWATRIGAIVLSLNELRRFGSFESLSARIDELTGLQDDAALATEVLRGLESILPADCRQRFRPTIAAIALSLRGLEDHHICEILAPGDPAAVRYWSILRVSLGAALSQFDGRTLLSSGPVQELIMTELETSRQMALDAAQALRMMLAGCSDRRRVEEAPRIAMIEGGEAALTALFANTMSMVHLISVGLNFAEGWLDFLAPEGRRQVCAAWAEAGKVDIYMDVWPFAELASRVGCIDEALALIQLDIERVSERPARSALRAFLEPTPENLRALESDLERKVKSGTVLGMGDVAAALALLDATNDGRLIFAPQRLLALEGAVSASRTFAASPHVQAHLAVTSGQRLMLQANWKAALLAFEEAERIGREIGEAKVLCQALERKAAASLELNRFNGAHSAASECLELSRSTGLIELEALAFERLIEIETRRANWRGAYSYATAYIRRSQEGIGNIARARRILNAIGQ